MAIVTLVVLLVGGIATTAVLLATGDDDPGDTRADPGTTTSDPTAPSSPTTAATPGTPSPSGATTPATPYSPTDDTDDDVQADVRASDFPGNWDFKLGDVEHHATLRDSWDYDSCGPVEKGTGLTQQRCEHAVQWSYSALGGKVRLTHVFLVFDTERHAKAAEARLEDTDLDLRAGTVFPDFVQGKWNKSVYGNVVGVTLATSRTKVADKELQSLVNYMNTDYRLALLFKAS